MSDLDPYAPEEFESLVAAVWDFDGCETDLTRFDELLTAALAFIARITLDGLNGFEETRAAELLRSMEQRALWGPGHPVKQPAIPPHEQEDHR